MFTGPSLARETQPETQSAEPFSNLLKRARRHAHAGLQMSLKCPNEYKHSEQTSDVK